MQFVFWYACPIKSSDAQSYWWRLRNDETFVLAWGRIGGGTRQKGHYGCRNWKRHWVVLTPVDGYSELRIWRGPWYFVTAVYINLNVFASHKLRDSFQHDLRSNNTSDAHILPLSWNYMHEISYTCWGGKILFDKSSVGRWSSLWNGSSIAFVWGNQLTPNLQGITKLQIPSEKPEYH